MKRTLATLLLLSMAPMTTAAEPVDEPTEIARRMVGIEAALVRIADSLENRRAGDRANLLLRRIERKEAKLARLEARLRTSIERKSSGEEELVRVEQYRAQIDKEIEEALLQGKQGPEIESQMSMMIEQTETQMKILKDRLERSSEQILELEGLIDESRRDIEYLDRRLEEILADIDDKSE